MHANLSPSSSFNTTNACPTDPKRQYPHRYLNPLNYRLPCSTRTNGTINGVRIPFSSPPPILFSSLPFPAGAPRKYFLVLVEEPSCAGGRASGIAAAGEDIVGVFLGNGGVRGGDVDVERFQGEKSRGEGEGEGRVRGE